MTSQHTCKSQGLHRRMVLVVIFFRIFEIIFFFALSVTKFDLMHDVEAIQDQN